MRKYVIFSQLQTEGTLQMSLNKKKHIQPLKYPFIPKQREVQGMGGKKVELTDLSWTLEINLILLLTFHRSLSGAVTKLWGLLRISLTVSLNEWGQKRLLGERSSRKDGFRSNQTQYTKLRFLVYIYGYKCIKTAIIRIYVWPAMESNFSGKEQRSLPGECQYKQEIFSLFNTLLCTIAVWSYFSTSLYSFTNFD